MNYKKIVSSIAFFPALIALIFLILSWLMILLDFSETGKNIKEQLDWLRLKDATTARSIISAIASGIITLAVFSFSMVMIVLNQAASQMSNRVLDELIGNRFQQVVLGCYVGTIVYALFLLSAIRDIDAGVYVPALSTYLLIAFTIIDIFLFIYFLHYITKSVKYETIIHRIYSQTMESMKTHCFNEDEPMSINNNIKGTKITAATGVFRGFNRNGLLHLCIKKNLVVSFLHPAGTFLLEHSPLFIVSDNNPTDECINAIRATLDIQRNDSIENSYYYGFRQLMEVAVKALSPGINDPGTAVESLRGLSILLAYRMSHFPDNEIRDERGEVRIIVNEKSFTELFTEYLLPIWDYGKKDRLIQNEMNHLLNQLKLYRQYKEVDELLSFVQSEKKKRKLPSEFSGV